MPGGLIGIGKNYASNATGIFDNMSSMEANRNAANEQIAAGKKAQKASNIGTGAGIGMMAGMQAGSVGGPQGAAIGAAVGWLASELF